MSDFNTPNADEIASIYIEAILDTANIDKSLSELNRKKYQLNVSVDDSALYDLNKHLDLKYRHLKEVNSYFSNNPITPFVDTRQIDNLTEQLTKLTNRTLTVKVNQEVTQEVTTKLSQTLVTDFSKIASKAITSSLKDALKDFRKDNESSGDVTKELKEGAKAVRSTLEGVLKDSLSFLAKPVKDLFTGFSEGISNDLGKQISKGLQQTFAKQLGLDFKKMGEQAGNSLLSTFNIKVKKENKILTGLTNTAGVAIGGISKGVEAYAFRKFNALLAKSLDDILQNAFSSGDLDTQVQQKTQATIRRKAKVRRQNRPTSVSNNSDTSSEDSRIPLELPIVAAKPQERVKVEIPVKQEPIKQALKVDSDAGLTPFEKAAKDSNKNFGYVLNEIGNFKVKNSPVGGGRQTVKRVATEIVKIKAAHQKALQTFKNLLDSAEELGDYALVDQIYTDFVKNSETAKTKIDQLLKEGKEAGLKQHGFNKLSTAKSGISRSIGKSSGSIPSKYQAIGRKSESEAVSIGLNVVAGLDKGLENKAFAKFGVANATAYLTAIKNAFGIASPAKAMIQIGEFIIQGLALGLNNRGRVSKEAENIGTAIKHQLKKQDIFSELDPAVSNTYTKSLASVKPTIAGKLLGTVMTLVSGALPQSISKPTKHLGLYYQGATNNLELDKSLGMQSVMGALYSSMVTSALKNKNLTIPSNHEVNSGIVDNSVSSASPQLHYTLGGYHYKKTNDGGLQTSDIYDWTHATNKITEFKLPLGISAKVASIFEKLPIISKLLGVEYDKQLDAYVKKNSQGQTLLGFSKSTKNKGFLLGDAIHNLIGGKPFIQGYKVDKEQLANLQTDAREAFNAVQGDPIKFFNHELIKKHTKSEPKNIGANLIDAIAQGMMASSGKPVKVVQTIMAFIENAAKKQAEIQSPSKVFLRIGKFLTEGLSAGITQTAKAPQNAIASVMKGVETKLKNDSIAKSKAIQEETRKASENFQKIFKEVVKTSGIDPKSAKTPGLSFLDIDQAGLYDVTRNQIILDKKARGRLASGKSTLSEIDTIVHESRHAIQSNFGKLGVKDTPQIPLLDTKDRNQKSDAMASVRGYREAARKKGVEPSRDELQKVYALEVDAVAFAGKTATTLHKNLNQILQTNANRVEKIRFPAPPAAPWMLRQPSFALAKTNNTNADDNNIVDIQKSLFTALNAVVKSFGDTKNQGGATLGVFISNALKAGGSSLLSGSGAGGFKAGNIPSMLGSVLSGNVGADFVAKAIPLLVPILGLKGLNLGDSIVKILNNNLAIKPGFLTDLFKSFTGIKLESTGFMQSAFSMLGVKGKGKGVTPSSDVINEKIKGNIADIGLGGSVEDLFNNLGNSFVNAVFGKLGMSGLKADLIKNVINNKIKSASGMITKSLSGVAGGQISSVLGAYAKGDVGGLTNTTSDFLKKAGIDLDPKKVAIAVGLILTTLTSLQKAFTEEGFNLGKALSQGFAESRKNWQNAGDDLKRSAKKSLGADSLTDISKDIVKRISRGSVVSKDMFDEFFNQIGNTFKARALKGVPGADKDGLMGNILSMGASVSTMFAPLATFATALTPLLIPMMPILGALGGLAMMVGKHLGALGNAIKTVEPLQRRLNFLGGSTEGGKREMDYARGVANRLNVPIKEGVDAYSQLAIAARGTKLEGDGIKELYEGISASLSALGISGGDASLVFMAYTQILSKGKLSMEELRQQLGEKFPPAMGLFAKAMGVSVAELGNMVSKGAVLSEDILPKVAKVLNADYGKSASSVNTFTGALTRLGNVGFDIALKLTNSFGGVFAMVTNLATGALSMLRDSLEVLIPVAGSVMIGVTAVTGVGLATILNTAPIAKFLATTNNLLISGLGALMANLAPYYLGIISDVADGWLGAQNDLMDNMAQGVTNIFVSFFTALDLMVREASDAPLFSDFIGKVDGMTPAIQGLKDALGGIFRIIPSGLVEMGALVLMFEQVQVLAKMFLVPSLKAVGESLKGVGANLGAMLRTAFSPTGFKDLFANTFGGALKRSQIVTSGIQAIGNALSALRPIAAEAAIALGVILFAKSDFTNPISDAIGKMASEMNGAMKSITSSVEDLAKKFGEAGKKAQGMADALPSKGLELNVGYALGLGGESIKSDDLIRARNAGDTTKLPWYLRASKEADKRENDIFRVLNKDSVGKAKKEADSFGIGKYFTGEEPQLTLAQTQLLNQFKDVRKNTKGLSSYVNSNNLTSATAGNLVSGDIKVAVDKVKELDSRLFKLGKERSNLSLINTTEARTKISEIDKELLNIEKERTDVAKPILAMFDDVNSWGTSINTLIEAIDSSTNPPDVKRRLKESLEPMKQMAKEASEVIKNNLPVKPLEDVYTKTISALRDVELAYDRFISSNKVDNANKQEALYSSGKNKGNLDQGVAALSLEDLQQQQAAAKSVRAIRQRSLENLTSISNFGRTDDQKKEIEDLRKNIKDDNEKIADLGSNIAKAKRDIRQTLVDQTKQVADYYRNAVKETVTITAEFQKAQNTLKNLNVQNRLKEALIGAGENIYTQFVDGLISSLQELSEIANTQVTANQKKIEYQNQIDEIKIQGAELQRNLPGQIVPFDKSVISDFNNQLVTVDGTVNQINSSVEKVETSLGNNLVEAVKKANTELDVTNQKVLNLTDESKTFTNVLKDGFNGIGSSISDVIGKTGDWLGQLMSGQGLMQGLNSGVAAIMNPETQKQNPIIGNTLSTLKNFFGGDAIKREGYKIVESVGSRIENVNSFEDLEKHHPSSGREPGRQYENIKGQLEEVRKTPDGRTLIKKDFVLMDSKGNQNVAIPAPASGYVKASSNFGMVDIYEDEKMTKLLAKALHLSNIAVKTGDQVKYGQTIGTQDGIGAGGKRTYAIHAHIEAERERFAEYIKDLKDGVFDFNGKGSATVTANNNKAVINTGNSNEIKRGGNALTPQEYAKLTPQGKQLYELRNNPNILAIANAVARAEGTDFRKHSKNFGYGMLIGNENITDFSGHPFVEGGRKYRHNSSASGRYQMMDFNYSKSRVQKQFGRGAKTDLESIINYEGKDNPGTFSPGLQDLYFIQSLKSRGVLDKVLKGQIDPTVLNKLAPHYASIQSGSRRSAYGGQGTPEGQHSNFLEFVSQQRLKDLNNTVIQGDFIQPNQMQSLARQGTQLNFNNAQKRYQTEMVNSGLSSEQENAKMLDFQRNFDGRMRTLQRGLFDAETNRIQSSRGIKDLGVNNLQPVKSPEQQFLIEQENRTRQYDDKIRELTQKLSELKGNLDKSEGAVQKAIADSTLKTLDPARYQQAVEGAKAAYSSVQADIKTYGKDLETLEKQKADTLKLNQQHFDKTEYFRLAELSIQSETQKIGILRQQVEQYRQLQQVDPLNALVLKIPALERNLAVMETEKELKQEIINADKEYYNKQLTQEQYEQKIKFAIKQNELKKDGIKLTLDEATATAELNRKTLELEKSQFLQQSKMKGLQLENDRISQASKNGLIDLKTLTNELTIKTNELTSAYERQTLELEKRSDLTPQEKLTETLRQSGNFRKEQQLLNDENSYKVKETELVTNPQALLNNRMKREDLLTKPGNDLRQLQIDSYKSRGGNEFVANKMSRNLAITQEKSRYERELAQLEIDVNKFNLDNPSIAITTEELTKLKESVKSLHDANIQKIGMDFKTFGMSLNSMVTDAVKGLGSSLTELIKGTKSLNDVLDGFFDQILTGFLEMGINSLLSGMLGGGGGLLGGLFGGGGLFYKGGVVPNYAFGGIANAFNKEASESGRKPLLAVVHEGEMLIPADRVHQLSKAGITPESLLGINNYANGGVVGGMRNTSAAQTAEQARSGNGLEVKYDATVINNQSYVTAEQFEEGVRKAAQAGAEGGLQKMQNKLANSSSFRRSVGI